MADFPQKVWQGQSRSRESLSNVKTPDHEDWMALVSEVQAIQRYLLNLSDNLDVMPDLNGMVKSLNEKLVDLDARLKGLQPPQNLRQEFRNLEDKVKEHDIRDEFTSLKANQSRIFVRTKRLDTAFKQAQEEMSTRLRVLENNIRNQTTRFESSTEKRIAELEAKVRELQEILETPDI